MKILYITTIGGTMGFFESFIRRLLDEGHKVDIATNESDSQVPSCYREWGCTVYSLDTSRSPLDRGNLRAIRQIRSLVAKEKYDIVHCHTPVAAVCTRLACRKARRHGTRVFYTAHGFHFYTGAPLKNWLIYYPVEWLCAHFTDVLITINKEDYERAKKKMKAKRVEYVPGVGVDLTKFGQTVTDKAAKRRELGVPEEAVWLLNVGELSRRKNQELIIHAIAEFENAFLTIVGKGDLLRHLEEVANEVGVSARVRFLGYRTDISELCDACDVFVFPSLQEGLPVALMEAMASGLPVVCSRIRGNTDLIDENGGALFDPHDVSDCEAALGTVLHGERNRFGEYNLARIRAFSLDRINAQMEEITNTGGCSHLKNAITRYNKRKVLGIPSDATLLLSVGELNENKNHETVIRAIADMDVYYAIAGEGDLHEHLQGVVDELGLSGRVKLLGYRDDVAELYQAADVFVFPSMREGLPVSVMEAMASALPVVCSRIRGNVDLIDDNGGVLFDPHSVDDCTAALGKLQGADAQAMGRYNAEKVQSFSQARVHAQMWEIYSDR